MNPRHRFLVLLAFACLLSLARAAVAQPTSPSHRKPLGTDVDPRIAEARLAQRVGHAQDANEFEKTIEQLAKSIKLDDLSPKDRQKLLDLAAKQLQENQGKDKPLDLKDSDLGDLLRKHPELKKELEKANLSPDELKALADANKSQQPGKGIKWDDPAFAKAMQKVFEGKKGDLSADDQKVVKDFFKNLGTNAPDTVRPIPGGGPPVVPPPDPRMNGSQAVRPPNLPPPPNDPPPSSNNNSQQPTAPQATPVPPPDPLPPQSSWFGKQLVKAFNHLDDGTKESVGDFLNLKELAKTSKDTPSATSPSKLPDVSGYMPKDTINDISSFFGDIKLPSMPNVATLAGPSPQADVGSAAAGGGMEGLVNVLIVALVVVAAGLVIAKVLASRKGAAGAGINAADLGGWPVQPSAVRTRADLVKCFEFLAVLLLGAHARTRHHLELAEEIGRQTPAMADPHQAEAAQTLARLYEIARYTPANEPLQPDDLAAARRELSYLAGAAGA